MAARYLGSATAGPPVSGVGMTQGARPRSAYGEVPSSYRSTACSSSDFDQQAAVPASSRHHVSFLTPRGSRFETGADGSQTHRAGGDAGGAVASEAYRGRPGLPSHDDSQERLPPTSESMGATTAAGVGFFEQVNHYSSVDVDSGGKALAHADVGGFGKVPECSREVAYDCSGSRPGLRSKSPKTATRPSLVPKLRSGCGANVLTTASTKVVVKDCPDRKVHDSQPKSPSLKPFEVVSPDLTMILSGVQTQLEALEQRLAQRSDYAQEALDGRLQRIEDLFQGAPVGSSLPSDTAEHYRSLVHEHLQKVHHSQEQLAEQIRQQHLDTLAQQEDFERQRQEELRQQLDRRPQEHDQPQGVNASNGECCACYEPLHELLDELKRLRESPTGAETPPQYNTDVSNRDTGTTPKKGSSLLSRSTQRLLKETINTSRSGKGDGYVPRVAGDRPEGRSGSRHSMGQRNSRHSRDSEVWSDDNLYELTSIAHNDVNSESTEDADHGPTIGMRIGKAMDTMLGGLSMMANGLPKSPGLKHFLVSSKFQLISVLVTLSNCLVIAIDVDMRTRVALDKALLGIKISETDERIEKVLHYLQISFLVWMCFELFVQLLAERGAFFRGDNWHWNLFDILVVTFSFLDMAVSGLLNLSFLKLARILRALRAGQVLRTLRRSQTFRKLAQSIWGAAACLGWSAALASIGIYMFTMVMMEGVAEFARDVTAGDPRLAEDPVAALGAGAEGGGQGYPILTGFAGPDSRGLVQDLHLFYGNFGRTSATLFRAFSGNFHWSPFAAPLAAINPIWGFVWIFFVCVMSFGLVNLLIGMVVDNMRRPTVIDRQLQFETDLAELRSLECTITDELSKYQTSDPNAKLGLDARFNKKVFVQLIQKPSIVKKLRELGMGDLSTKTNVLFKIVDVDANGHITAQKMASQLMAMRGEAKASDMAHLVKEVEKIDEAVTSLGQIVFQLSEAMLVNDSESEGGEHDVLL